MINLIAIRCQRETYKVIATLYIKHNRIKKMHIKNIYTYTNL